MYHHFPFQEPPKFSQIVSFGFKTNHLATLKQSQALLSYQRRRAISPHSSGQFGKARLRLFICYKVSINANVGSCRYFSVSTRVARKYI
jgi:hypothetical protein